MSVIPITCDNCGAKYKLPPTFKGTQAKCQKCGSVIDVQKQREAQGDGDSPAAAAKPAARPAAAAKPAVDRSKGRAAGGSKRAAAAASGKADKPARTSSSRSRRGAKDDGGDDSPRRGREPKKKDNTPMIMGGVGLVAIIVVVVFMMGGDDKKTGKQEASNTDNSTNTADANANKAEANAGDTKPAEGTKPDEGAKPAEGTKPDEGTKPAEGTKPDEGSKAAEVTTPAPAAPKPGKDAPKWMKQKFMPQTMSEVKSAAELYGEVVWPESISADKKAEIMGYAEDLDVAGGIRSIRAKAKLVKAGYAGLFGILETLQKLDYKQPGDAAFGFELNKALEDITGGLNARYVPVQADEVMHPAKAQWNTKNVKAWMTTFAKWPDEAAFRKAKKARGKKKNG